MEGYLELSTGQIVAFAPIEDVSTEDGKLGPCLGGVWTFIPRSRVLSPDCARRL